jgi:ABC-type Mn2+/Zn2+ transport system permease subunit
LLFGDPLSASSGDIAMAAILAVAGGLVLAALQRPLAALVFDPIGTPSLGVRAGSLRAALAVLLAAVVCIAAQGLGTLLVLAAIVAPPLAVRRHASSAPQAVVGGAAVGALAGIAGIYASFKLDVAAGAAVALALCAVAAIGSALPARGRQPRRASAG